MKRINISLLIVLITILTGCTNSNDMEYEGFKFDGLAVDLTDAAKIGISSTDNINVNNIRKLSNMTQLSSEKISDNTLVKETDNGDVVPLDFRNEENETVEISYSPIYVERRGNYSVSIVIKDDLDKYEEMYGNIESDIAWFVPLMLESSDPVSMVFSTGISDLGYQMLNSSFSPAVNVILIHDDGSVYDLHSLLHRTSEEKKAYYETFSELSEEIEILNESGEVLYTIMDNLPVNFVHSVSIYDDSVQLVLNHGDYLSSNDYNERENYFYINTYTHNTDTKEVEDEIYTSEQKEQHFTPAVTDKYGNTLVLADSDYKLLKNNDLYEISSNTSLRESLYILIDNEIYILGYSEFDEATHKETLFLGKINEIGDYIQLGEFEANEMIFSNYRTGFFGATEYYGKTYYMLESYSFMSGAINEDRFYIQGGFDNFLDVGAIVLDFASDSVETRIFDQARNFKIGNSFFFISENRVDVYNSITDTTTSLVDNVTFNNFYEEPYKYHKDYIYLSSIKGDLYYINIFSGILYINDLPEDQIFSEVQLGD